mgnify:CR=1 FL=1
MRQLSRVHIPGASGDGPLTPFVPCTLSLFRPIVHPGICQVGPACDRPLYARYVDGHVTAHVTGRVNRLLARVGAGYQSGLLENSPKVPPRACGCGCNLDNCPKSTKLVPRRCRDIGREEIRRLWATVWVLPAILREEGPGAGFAEFCKGRVPPRVCGCGCLFTFGHLSKSEQKSPPRACGCGCPTQFPEEPGTHPRFPKEPGGYRARSSRAPGPVSAWCRLR